MQIVVKDIQIPSSKFELSSRRKNYNVVYPSLPNHRSCWFSSVILDCWPTYLPALGAQTLQTVPRGFFICFLPSPFFVKPVNTPHNYKVAAACNIGTETPC